MSTNIPHSDSSGNTNQGMLLVDTNVSGAMITIPSSSSDDGTLRKKRRYETDNESHQQQHQQPEQVASLADLPMELILRIVDMTTIGQSGLRQLTLVNKRFYSLINPVLWRAPTLRTADSAQQFLHGIATGQPPRLGHLVRKLDLSIKYWDDIRLSLLIPHLCFLEELRIASTTSINDYSFRNVPYHCLNLNTLTLPARLCFETSYDAVGQYCRNLIHLTLFMGSWRNNRPFHLIADNCPLEHLVIHTLQWQNVVDLTRLQHLTHLEMKKCSSGPISTLIAATHQTAQGTTIWPRLEYLKLDDGSRLHDLDILIPFLRSHQHLVHLELTGCRHWTDDTLVALMATTPPPTATTAAHQHHQRPPLQRLCLSDNLLVTPEAIRQLVNNAPDLNLLTLVHFAGVTKTDFPGARGTKGVLELKQKVLDQMRQLANENQDNND